MYVIIWEYQVRAECFAEFEEIYSPTGAWATLFQKSKGYLGTELLLAESEVHRYITIDRWASSLEHEAFVSDWKKEYQELDAQSEHLTEHEILLGKWEVIFPKNH